MAEMRRIFRQVKTRTDARTTHKRDLLSTPVYRWFGHYPSTSKARGEFGKSTSNARKSCPVSVCGVGGAQSTRDWMVD